MAFPTPFPPPVSKGTESSDSYGPRRELFFPLCLGQTGVEQQGPSSWSQAWPFAPRGTLAGLTGVSSALVGEQTEPAWAGENRERPVKSKVIGDFEKDTNCVFNTC